MNGYTLCIILRATELITKTVTDHAKIHGVSMSLRLTWSTLWNYCEQVVHLAVHLTMPLPPSRRGIKTRSHLRQRTLMRPALSAAHRPGYPSRTAWSCAWTTMMTEKTQPIGCSDLGPWWHNWVRKKTRLDHWLAGIAAPLLPWFQSGCDCCCRFLNVSFSFPLSTLRRPLWSRPYSSSNRP